MDDKEKYKQALERAKRLYENSNGMILKKWLIGVFPELAESEDERIREEIHIYLDWLDGRKDYAPKGVYSIKDMIAWLEKQGEQKATTLWHDVSEVPDEMQELLVEWESPDATWHNIAFYDAETKAFRYLYLKQPISNVTRWAYVSDILTQSVTKISEQVPSILDLKLMDCPLSVKTMNAVKVAINKPAKDVTLGDIIKCNKAELLALRNFGKVSLKELEDFLADYGLKLEGE